MDDVVRMSLPQLLYLVDELVKIDERREQERRHAIR